MVPIVDFRKTAKSRVSVINGIDHFAGLYAAWADSNGRQSHRTCNGNDPATYYVDSTELLSISDREYFRHQLMILKIKPPPNISTSGITIDFVCMSS